MSDYNRVQSLRVKKHRHSDKGINSQYKQKHCLKTTLRNGYILVWGLILLVNPIEPAVIVSSTHINIKGLNIFWRPVPVQCSINSQLFDSFYETHLIIQRVLRIKIDMIWLEIRQTSIVIKFDETPPRMSFRWKEDWEKGSLQLESMSHKKQ